MEKASVRLLSVAQLEVAEALDWYLQKSERASLAFLDEFEEGIEKISEAPTRWPVFEQDTRRYVLARFPFSIIYRWDGSSVQVVSVAHQNRRPGYWHER